MQFPATILIQVESQVEYDAVLAVLGDAAGNRDDRRQMIIRRVLDELSLCDGSGERQRLPEAYVMVENTKMAEGSRAKMNERFDGEIAAHGATVLMFARDAGTAYRPVRSRLRGIV